MPARVRDTLLCWGESAANMCASSQSPLLVCMYARLTLHDHITACRCARGFERVSLVKRCSAVARAGTCTSSQCQSPSLSCTRCDMHLPHGGKLTLYTTVCTCASRHALGKGSARGLHACMYVYMNGDTNTMREFCWQRIHTAAVTVQAGCH
jgi:hypothetical protein